MCLFCLDVHIWVCYWKKIPPLVVKEYVLEVCNIVKIIIIFDYLYQKWYLLQFKSSAIWIIIFDFLMIILNCCILKWLIYDKFLRIKSTANNFYPYIYCAPSFYLIHSLMLQSQSPSLTLSLSLTFNHSSSLMMLCILYHTCIVSND